MSQIGTWIKARSNPTSPVKKGMLFTPQEELWWWFINSCTVTLATNCLLLNRSLAAETRLSGLIDRWGISLFSKRGEDFKKPIYQLLKSISSLEVMMSCLLISIVMTLDWNGMRQILCANRNFVKQNHASLSLISRSYTFSAVWKFRGWFFFSGNSE